CELDVLDAIIKLVCNGVGVALVPDSASSQEWPAGVRSIDLQLHTFHRDIGLVHRARRSLTEPVNALVQIINEQAINTH
ncbi:LysR substrate-binding domain-containing protein, partial [Pseudomonas syringae group genomosp. 7]|uniref:LysR substrate-binding domain-containing protein n=1 Tax=Pseudomonas syringae group genomosp. 7 TaxID=251699 RepID=UPI00376FF34C